MKQFFFFLFFFPVIGFSQTQEICRRTTVFFETDQHSLTKETLHKLDSLVTTAGEREFLVELYGHTDTVGSISHNEKLAMQRMESVKEYLLSKTKTKLKFKEKNLTETNYKISMSNDKNLAFNRCVDIFLIPIENGKLVFNGPKNESVETPIDYFEPCGVCNSAPSIKSYYSGEEAATANITLLTTDNQPLVTSGMVNFDFKPCTAPGDRSKKDTCITYKICVPPKNSCPPSVYKAVEREGKFYWKLTGETISFNGKCMKLCSPDLLINLDCLDSTLSTPKLPGACITTPSEFSYQCIFLIGKNGDSDNKSEKDSMNFFIGDTTMILHIIGKSGDDYYALSITVDSLPSHWKKNIKYFTPEFARFTKLTYSDTILKVKKGKHTQKLQFGFYLEEYKLFIPMEQPVGKYYEGKAPSFPCQYAYRSGKKLYVLNEKSVKEKYQSKKNIKKVKTKYVTSKAKKIKEFYSAPK